MCKKRRNRKYLKEDVDSIRISKTLVEIAKRIPLWLSDYHIFAGTQDDAFARNQIRNQVIPRLEMINEQAVEHIGWLCEDIKEVTTYLTDQIDQSARTFIRSSDACHRKKNLPLYRLLPFANSQTLPPLSVTFPLPSFSSKIYS